MVEIAIASVPVGANVVSGNTFLGITPFTASLPADSGVHALTFSGLGYETQTYVLDVSSPKPVSVTLKSTAKAGADDKKEETTTRTRRHRRRRTSERKKPEEKKPEVKKSIPLPD